MKKGSFAYLASLACFTLGAGCLSAADYYVTQATTAGSSDSCSTCATSGNTCCTLIDAITLANSNSGSTVHIMVPTVTYSGALTSPCVISGTTTIESGVGGSVINFGSSASSCTTDFTTPIATVFQPTGALTLVEVVLQDSNTGSNVININDATLIINGTSLDGTSGNGFVNNTWTVEGTSAALTFGSSGSYTQPLPNNISFGKSNAVLTLTNDSSSTVTLSGNIGPLTGVTGSELLSNSSNIALTGILTITGSGTLAAASGKTFTVQSTLEGSGALTIGGGGTILLEGSSNTFTGSVTVTSSTLSVNSLARMGTPSAFTLEGGVFDTTGSFSTGSTPVTITSGSLSPSSGTTLTIPANIAPGSGSSYSLLVEGGGTVILSGNNSQSNTITVDFIVQSSSTLSAANVTNLGGSSSLITLNLGTLALTGTSTFTQAVALATTSSTINVASGQTATLSGTVSGAGILNKTGSGTLELEGTDTHTGGTTLTAGVLSISSDAQLGNTSGSINGNGGTLLTTSGITLSSTRSIPLSAGTTTSFDAGGNTTTIAGTIIGSGTFEQINTGTLILTGTNSGTWNTTISGGTLSLSAADNIGTGTVTLAGGILDTTATMTLSNPFSLTSGGEIDIASGTLTMTGAIGGLQSLIKVGTGSLVLSGTNTYEGGTSITGGVLSVSSVQNLGSNDTVTLSGATLLATSSLTLPGTITLSGSSGIDASAGAIFTVQSTLEGSGALTIGSGGTVVLEGSSNTFTGSVTVISSTLSVDSLARMGTPSAFTLEGGVFDTTGSFSTGSTPITIASGSLSPSSGTILTIPANIAPGSGSSYSLIVEGGGTVILSGNNSQSNTITVGFTVQSSATLSAANVTNLGGSSSLITLNLGTLALTGTSTFTQAVALATTSSTINIASGQTATLSGIVSGTGILNKTGTGTLALSQTNSYTGGTSIQAGTLSISSANNVHTGTVTLAGGILDVTATATLSNAFAVTSSSTLTSTGTTMLSGLLTGSNGATLTLTGSGVNSIEQVAVNTGTFTINGTIGGTQSLTKTGAGTCVISDVCTYTGKTYVDAGTLEVDGNIVLSGDPIVASGAILSGTGTVGDTIIYGILKGGNPSGTLNVIGDVSLNEGAGFATHVTPSSVSLVEATGAITIDPSTTLLLAIVPGFYSEESRLILRGASLSGHFDTTFSTYTFSTLFYTDREAYFDLKSAVELVTGGNATQIAKAIDAAINHNRQTIIDMVDTGHIDLPTLKKELQIPRVVASLLQFTTTSDMTYALNQMNPAQMKGMTIAQENNAVRVRESVSQRMMNELDRQTCLLSNRQDDQGKKCCEKPKKKFTAWVGGLGDTLTQDSLTNYWGPLAGYRVNTGGVVTGFDTMFYEHFYAGAIGAYTNSHVHFRSKKGTGNISTGYAGVYMSAFGSGSIGKMFYANASVIGSWSDYNAERPIEYNEIDLLAKSEYGGNQILSHLDTGINFDFLGVTIRPFDSFDYTSQVERGYEESNAGDWELTFGRKNSIMLRNELGLQFTGCLCTCSSKWIFSPKLSWVRETRIKGDTLNVRFTDASDTFFIQGYFPDRSLIAPGLAITGMMLQDALKFDLYYNGEFKGDYSSNSVGGQVSYSF